MKISDHNFLFYGAGAAGVGIADLIAVAIAKERPELTLAQARKRIWLVDSRGLVTAEQKYMRDKHKVIDRQQRVVALLFVLQRSELSGFIFNRVPAFRSLMLTLLPVGTSIGQTCCPLCSDCARPR